MSIFVGPGERGLIVGQTGSGKTVMLQEQARQAVNAPVVIYDTKGDDGFFDVAMDDEDIEVVESLSAFKALIKKPKRKQPEYVLVRPSSEEVTDALRVDQYLVEQYEACRPSYAIIDEAYQMHRAGGQAGPGLIGMLTRGRSKGISTIMATQRPMWLSRFCLTEASKYYIYFLRDDDDRKRLSQVSPYPRDLIVDSYNFWFYKQGEKDGILYKPLPLRAPDRGYTAENIESSITWI